MARRGFPTEEPVRSPRAGHLPSPFKPMFLYSFLTAFLSFTPSPHNCFSHSEAVVSTGQNCTPYPQASNPHSEMACLSPGKVQSLAELLQPRQLYPHPALSCCSQNHASPSSHLQKSPSGTSGTRSWEPILSHSQQKCCPPALPQHTTGPHALWGCVFRAVGHFAQVGHSSEPSTVGLSCLHSMKLACRVPQGVFDSLLQQVK